MEMYIDTSGQVYAGDRQIRGFDGDDAIYDPIAPDKSDNTVWDVQSQLWIPIVPPLRDRLTDKFDTLSTVVQLQFAAHLTLIRYQLDQDKPDMRTKIQDVLNTIPDENLTADLLQLKQDLLAEVNV